MTQPLPIIIPTFNRCEVTKQCVTSLLQGTHTEFQIILCDSDSTDGTRDYYSEQASVSVLNVGSDKWWTGAVNQGITYAISQGYSDYVLVLNDDINLPSMLIERLLVAARQNAGNIISPAQSSATGLFLGMNYSKLFKNYKVVYADQVTKPTEVQSTNGCCLLIPIDVFKTVGLFDEINCPQLAADVEFQIRAGRAGFPTVACPDIVIIQHPNTNYHQKLKLSTLLTYKGSPVHLAAYLTHGKTLFNGSLRFAIFGIRYHYRYAKSLLKAIFFCLKGP